MLESAGCPLPAHMLELVGESCYCLSYQSSSSWKLLHLQRVQFYSALNLFALLAAAAASDRTLPPSIFEGGDGPGGANVS